MYKHPLKSIRVLPLTSLGPGFTCSYISLCKNKQFFHHCKAFYATVNSDLLWLQQVRICPLHWPQCDCAYLLCLLIVLWNALVRHSIHAWATTAPQNVMWLALLQHSACARSILFEACSLLYVQHLDSHILLFWCCSTGLPCFATGLPDAVRRQ